MQRLAVRSMVPIMEASLTEAYASGDVETVRAAIPAQLLLLRGVCSSDPGKTEVWTTAVQLYASYALIFIEPDDPERAGQLYAEGLDLGLRFLRRHDWFRAAWQEGPDALRAAIAERRPHDLAPIMMWTAACLGKHILGNLHEPRLVADLPFVHVLSDAAIDLAGGYFYGMPYVLKGVMLAMTPPMLGGDQELSNRLFQKAFALADRRLLTQQVLYAQYYCTATLDEELFDQILHEVLEAPADLFPEMRLINLLAQARARVLLDSREDIF